MRKMDYFMISGFVLIVALLMYPPISYDNRCQEECQDCGFDGGDSTLYEYNCVCESYTPLETVKAGPVEAEHNPDVVQADEGLVGLNDRVTGATSQEAAPEMLRVLFQVQEEPTI